MRDRYVRWELFALFMDYVMYPVAWLVFPDVRKHRRYVKIQDAHLDKTLHPKPDPNCDYCQAGEAWRNRRKDL